MRVNEARKEIEDTFGTDLVEELEEEQEKFRGADSYVLETKVFIENDDFVKVVELTRHDRTFKKIRYFTAGNSGWSTSVDLEKNGPVDFLIELFEEEIE